MTQPTINITKLHAKAVTPSFSTHGDAGADLYAIESVTLAPGDTVGVGTGIAIELPLGTVGLVHPRSGLAAKQGITVLNAPGTIDSGYRGEIRILLHNTSNEVRVITTGDRIAQLVVQEHLTPTFVEVEQLSDSVRGAGGFGSTGA